MVLSLKQKALSGTKWSTIAQFGQYGISFFLSMILARLLEPSEFGLIGMITIFMVIAKVFINSGLSSAIIRSNNSSQRDYSTVFYFNIAVSLSFYFALFFLAPLIANFYNEPLLIGLTRWVSLVFVINAFGLIQNAILVKDIDFKTQTLCNLIGLAASVLVSGFMAYSGYGVWSLVGQILSQALITNILLWFLSKWRPHGGFSFSSFKKLWAFGSKILATSIITQTIDNIDSLLIGKVFNATQLGFYTRAKSSRNIPQQIASGVLSSVSFSVLANVVNNPQEFNRKHFQFLKLGAFIFIPIIFGLIATAEPFIIIFYSEKWIPSVLILQIIALYSIPQFLGVLFSQTIMAYGDGKLYLKINSLKRIIGLLPIPIGLLIGFYPFLISLIICSFIGLFIDVFYVSRLLKETVKYYFKILLKPFLMSLFMAVIVYYAGKIIPLNLYLTFLLQFALGLIAYLAFSAAVKSEELNYLKNILNEKIRRK